ncbi:hypothetical protein [Salinarimonas soli]|uniref:Uncharacterized protein n=1 Tax=Salinarimonas soli TaxID=1638099 RepID=A0A5B2V985_9HYPH|nr:hypothetical protein [Salinarimonas soli]KAA2235584.1 hypothetical protein F0L46_18970 [Salinarimonas soli]
MSDPWAIFPDAPSAAPAAIDPWSQFPDAPVAPTPAAPPAPAALPAGPSTADQFKALGIPDPRQPIPQAKPRSGLDMLIEGLQGAAGMAAQGVRGASEGAMNLAGLPVDLVNAAPMLLNLIPGVQRSPSLSDLVTGEQPRGFGPMSRKPFAGSEWLKENLLPAPPPAPVNAAERFTKRIGEEIGASAVPTAGLLAAGARAGVQGAREMGPLARMFVEPAAVDPGRFLQKEVMASGLMGVGAATGGELTQGQSKGVQGAAELGGGLAALGAGAMTRATVPKVIEVLNALRGSPNYTDRVVRETVVNRLGEAANLPGARMGETGDFNTDPLVEAIQRGSRVNDAVPGYQESLADRTQNPGLAALEYGRQSGPNSGMYTQRVGENTNAIDAAMARSEPQGSPGQLRVALEDRRDNLLGEASANVEAVQRRFDEATARLNTAMNAEGRGANIRAALEDAKEAAREVEREAWSGVANAGSADVTPLAERFRAITDATGEASQRTALPRELTSIPDDLVRRAQPDETVAAAQGLQGPQPAVYPISQVTDLRSRLSTAAREARTAGDDNKARLIDQYIEAIDGHLEATVPENLRQAYEQARGVSRDLNDRFTRPQTAIAQSLDRQQGMYRQPDSAVPSKFVQADEGRIADFESLMREAGNDDRVRSAVRDQIVSDVRSRGLLEQPDQLDAYLRQYGRVFERFPDLRQELGTAAGVGRAVRVAEDAATSLVRDLGSDNVRGRGPVGRYLVFGDENAERAMRGVLNAPRPGEAIDELLNFAGNTPEAVEGARRILWEMMQKNARRGGESTKSVTGQQPWMPNALKSFLDDPRNSVVLARLYRDDPSHLMNISNIAEALQGVEVRTRAKAPNSSGTAQASNVLTPETLQSRFYAYKRGQVSGSYLFTSIAAVAGRRAVTRAREGAINRLLDEALLNPEAAAVLLKENNPANRAALARRAKTWMPNQVSTVLDMLEDEDPVKDAIFRR